MAKKADPFEAMAKAIAEGKMEITNIRINVCGKCYEGTMVPKCSPDWMNCVQCDKCGHKASR